MEASPSVGSPKVDLSGRETAPNWMTAIANPSSPWNGNEIHQR